MTETQTPITVIGLGSMGTALAGTLVAAGHPTTVWNRTARGVDGAATAATAVEAIAASPLVLVCIVGAEASSDILAGAGDLSGRTVVNYTTTTPKFRQRIVDVVERQGGAYLDGAIIAAPEQVGTESAFVLYSGAQTALDAQLDTLAVLGAPMPVGDASLWDLALLSGTYGAMGGLFHALALVRSSGESLETFAGVLGSFIGGMGQGVAAMAERIESGDHETTSPVSMLAATKILEVTEDAGVRTDLLAPVMGLFQEGVDAGHGAKDGTVLVDLLVKKHAQV